MLRRAERVGAEIEGYCEAVDVDYDDIVVIYEEIGYVPPAQFSPRVSGGHCNAHYREARRSLTPVL